MKHLHATVLTLTALFAVSCAKPSDAPKDTRLVRPSVCCINGQQQFQGCNGRSDLTAAPACTN